MLPVNANWYILFCNSVAPFSDSFAPPRISLWITHLWPFIIASCNGSMPLLSKTFGLAPFSRRVFTISMWPSEDARCRAVLPVLSIALMSTPSLIIKAIIEKSPDAAASIILIWIGLILVAFFGCSAIVDWHEHATPIISKEIMGPTNISLLVFCPLVRTDWEQNQPPPPSPPLFFLRTFYVPMLAKSESLDAVTFGPLGDSENRLTRTRAGD